HYSLENISLALNTILDTLELSSIYLFGYSFGGRVALTYAHHHPNRVEHLFLESSSFGLNNEEERNERQLKDNQLAQKLLKVGMSSFVDEWQELDLFASQKSLPTEIFEREINQKKIQSIKTMSLALQYGSVATQLNFQRSETIKQLQITYIAGSLDQK
ncbi:alpha/beta fold hydrolase, partial [Acinetobacter baumannii]|uniref:alpha/beta fold hydrolase n=1 Tax=Acinetobacter baumannii TaxID=470 RepID=UPI001AED0524